MLRNNQANNTQRRMLRCHWASTLPVIIAAMPKAYGTASDTKPR